MRKPYIGELAERVDVAPIGNKSRVSFRAQTGEEIGADLSREQALKIRDALTAILAE